MSDGYKLDSAIRDLAHMELCKSPRYLVLRGAGMVEKMTAEELNKLLAPAAGS